MRWLLLAAACVVAIVAVYWWPSSVETLERFNLVGPDYTPDLDYFPSLERARYREETEPEPEPALPGAGYYGVFDGRGSISATHYTGFYAGWSGCPDGLRETGLEGVCGQYSPRPCCVD